jgi:hypothetical protein
MNLLAKLCHGRFYDILPKEYSEHSLNFYGDNKKRCILTIGVSQILLFTKLISEIKYILSKGFFTQSYFFDVISKKQKQLPPLFVSALRQQW